MWIEDYRLANGLELDEFARRVNIVGRKMNPPLEGTVSDTLIHILERSREPRTNPRIANAIAMVCGATAEQRDSIVAEKHRGKWEPVKDVFAWGDWVFGKQTRPPLNDHSVVMVDLQGRVLHRYESAKSAAKHSDISADSILNRCNHRMKNEFYTCLPYTYRFAREWDKMSMAEKLKDLGAKIDE